MAEDRERLHELRRQAREAGIEGNSKMIGRVLTARRRIAPASSVPRLGGLAHGGLVLLFLVAAAHRLDHL